MTKLLLKHLHGVVKQSLGFPIGAVLTDMSGNILSIEANAKGRGNSTTHKTHAEFIALSGLPKGHPMKLRLYVTYPPCSHCLNEFIEKGVSIEVIYLFDPWGKRYQGYLKSIKLKQYSSNSPLIKEMWSLIGLKYDSFNHRFSKKRILKMQDTTVMLRMAPRTK